jgi:hypothetical protein
VKTYLQDNPAFAMIYFFGLLIFTFGYLMFLTEREYDADCSVPAGKFNDYSNAVWLILTTVFTVGYGEIAP